VKRWVQSGRDSADTIDRIQASLGVKLELPKSSQATCEEPQDGVIFVHLDGLIFIQTKDNFVPFLGSRDVLDLFPSVTVDEDAIRFLLNGADVMRPGIRKLSDWGGSGKVVVVKEEKKGRAISVGRSLVTSAEAEKMSKGPCLENIHHVGDRYWNLFKKV